VLNTARQTHYVIFDEILAIAIIEKDRFPAIPPAQDMKDRARILNAHWPWHPSILPQTTDAGKSNTEHIYGLTPLTNRLAAPCWSAATRRQTGS